MTPGSRRWRTHRVRRTDERTVPRVRAICKFELGRVAGSRVLLIHLAGPIVSGDVDAGERDRGHASTLASRKPEGLVGEPFLHDIHRALQPTCRGPASVRPPARVIRIVRRGRLWTISIPSRFRERRGCQRRAPVLILGRCGALSGRCRFPSEPHLRSKVSIRCPDAITETIDRRSVKAMDACISKHLGCRRGSD